MPRNGSGNYTLPVSNPVISGTPIQSEWANSTMSDVALALTNSLSRQGQGGMLAPFRFANGDVFQPSASFTDDPTSGLYRAAPSDIRMSISGADVMRWRVPSLGPQINVLVGGVPTWANVLTSAESQGTVTIGTQDFQSLRWDNSQLTWIPSSVLFIGTTGVTVDGTGGLLVQNGPFISNGAGTNSFRAGFDAGAFNQGNYAVAIGNNAGAGDTTDPLKGQGANAIAIGNNAGKTTQSESSVAIGQLAGSNLLGLRSVAIGYLAGNDSGYDSTIAIGSQAGQEGQLTNSIAVGLASGSKDQGSHSVAVGDQAGYEDQGGSSVAVGRETGKTSQGEACVAIGSFSAESSQKNNAVAIGNQAGRTNQSDQAIAIGLFAGQTSQKENSIAAGNKAGREIQGANAIAIGTSAAEGDSTDPLKSQGDNAIAVGIEAGNTTQGTNAVALGRGAGYTSQGAGAVAIGNLTGKTSQGNYAVAIGQLAGETSQPANGIIISSTGAAVNSNDVGDIILASSRGTIELNQYGFVMPVGYAASTGGDLFVRPVGLGSEGGQIRLTNGVDYGVAWNIDCLSGTEPNFRIYNGVASTIAQLVWGTAVWSITSDINQKDVVGNVENATEMLSGLSTIYFKYKDESNSVPFEDRIVNTGLIAQEVQEVLPCCVDTDEKTGMLTMRYNDLIAVLIKSNQELTARVKALEA